LAGSRDDIYLKGRSSTGRKNLTVYEMLTIDFIYENSSWDLLKWRFSKIREATLPFRNVHDRFYLGGILMAFIERELFHDKRSKLTVYERFRLVLFAESFDGIY
jgi:hypothetical protein